MSECKIAEKLVELRTERGVTQEDVAQSLSISNKTISKWENGASMPDLPMLIELSKYYGGTTDALLGLSDMKKPGTREEICTSFKGLDRKESVLKAFEIVRSIVPAMYHNIGKSLRDNNVYDIENVFPSEILQGYRSAISLHEFFEFSASSENVNIEVMMLRNKANFAWMNDPSKQKRIVRLFEFLSNKDTISVLYFIHSPNCSESFTADYIADHTGVTKERATEILNEFCATGACHWVVAHLAEGEVRVYECRGDGMMLALITLAFERMCGEQSFEYNLNGRCKMIGGK